MRNITISEILRTILYTNILHFSAFCKCPFSALAFFYVLVHKTSTSLCLFPDPGMNCTPAPIGSVLRRLPFAEDARPNRGELRSASQAFALHPHPLNALSHRRILCVQPLVRTKKNLHQQRCVLMEVLIFVTRILLPALLLIYNQFVNEEETYVTLCAVPFGQYVL